MGVLDDGGECGLMIKWYLEEYGVGSFVCIDDFGFDGYVVGVVDGCFGTLL